MCLTSPYLKTAAYHKITEVEVDIQESEVPASGKLVQTGGIPAYIFFIAGGACILVAVLLALRKDNPGSAD